MDNRVTIWRSYLESGINTGQRLEAIILEPTPLSLNEATRHLPSGGYTTFRTFDNFRVLRLADHVERLEIAARLADKPLELAIESIRTDLHQVFSRSQPRDLRVRIIVDLEIQPGTLYYLAEELHLPAQLDYDLGVPVVTQHMQRTNPLAKLTQFVEKAEAVRQHIPTGTNEVIMIDQNGSLLEGLSSNFFAVRNSTIVTADEGILPGITRSLALEVIESLGIPVIMKPFQIDELGKMDEAFLTSTTRAVLPVTSIDSNQVGNGSPGPLTKQILANYLERIEAELEAV